MAMNAKQQRFADEYLIDRNATQAALRAGYSTNTAYSIGQRLLKDPEIKAAVDAAEDARKQRTELNADWVLRRLQLLADSDIRRLYNADGSIKLPTEWDDATAFAVQGLEVVTEKNGRGRVEHVAKFKMADKRGPLVDLGRYLKLFVDKVELEHSGGVTVILNGDEANL